MEKIASFQVDHTKFSVGLYISRIDDDIVTYDVRMVKPNGGVYLETPSMHTIEHLFATYARNSEFGKNIVYVGPMLPHRFLSAHKRSFSRKCNKAGS